MIAYLIGVFVLGTLAVYIVLNLLIAIFQAPRRKSKKPLKNDPLVPCQYCQSYIPRSEAIQKHGCYYCCEEHQRME